jgi:hypothetical protein
MTATRPLHPEEAGDWADLLGTIEDWLLHASETTLADLGEFLHRPGVARAVIGELGTIVCRLRQLGTQDAER